MSFYVKKRRMPIIQVVPLIDILTVVLIFFVVTTTFRKQTRPALLKIALPEAAALAAEPESAPRTPLAVSAQDEVSLDEAPVALEDLPEALRQWRAQQPGGRLELKADEKAPLGTLVKVWDALAAAGFEINRDVPTKILLNRAAAP